MAVTLQKICPYVYWSQLTHPELETTQRILSTEKPETTPQSDVEAGPKSAMTDLSLRYFVESRESSNTFYFKKESFDFVVVCCIVELRNEWMKWSLNWDTLKTQEGGPIGMFGLSQITILIRLWGFGIF